MSNITLLFYYYYQKSCFKIKTRQMTKQCGGQVQGFYLFIQVLFANTTPILDNITLHPTQYYLISIKLCRIIFFLMSFTIHKENIYLAIFQLKQEFLISQLLCKSCRQKVSILTAEPFSTFTLNKHIESQIDR